MAGLGAHTFCAWWQALSTLCLRCWGPVGKGGHGVSVCARCQGQPDLGHVVTLPLLTCHLAQAAQASLACFLFQKMLPCVCVLGGGGAAGRM